MKWKKLLLFGSSNTQFGFSRQESWVALLSDLLQRKCDVMNRGFSGYNTSYIRQILPELLEEFEPESTCGIILCLGSNDAVDEGFDQHVPLKQYRQNLDAILTHITAKWGFNKKKIIIISPQRLNDSILKINNSTKDITSIVTRFDATLTKYAQQVTEFAQSNDLLYVDLNKAMHDNDAILGNLLRDGIHLSTLGGQLLFDHLKPIIVNHIANDLKINYTPRKLIDPVNQIITQF